MTNIFILIFTVFFAINIVQGEVNVAKLPKKVHYGAYSEEVWIYLTKPISGLSLYLFYETDVSDILLESKDFENFKLTFTIKKHNINENNENNEINDNFGTLESDHDGKVGQWTHIAVSISGSPQIFVNGLRTVISSGWIMLNYYRVSSKLT